MSGSDRSFRPPVGRLHEVVDRLALRAGDRVVIRDPVRALTGRDLHWQVEMIALELARLGVRSGTRVAVVGENGVAMVAALFATSRLGAWMVPVNARLTRHELEGILAHAEPAAVLFATDGSPEAAAHAEAFSADPTPLGRFDLTVLVRRGARPEPRARRAPEQVAAVLYTSGTTGQPKGVMLTHRNLLFVAYTTGRLRRLAAGERIYGALPVAHVYGLASVLLAGLLHGAEVVLVPRFVAEEAARALEAGEVQVFLGVPVMYRRLLELAEARGRPIRPARLRYAAAGGAPLDPALIRRIEAMWGLPLHNGYGLTETAPTTHMTRMERPGPPGSVGLPLPHVEQRVVDPRTGRELPVGEVGELWVRGPGVMKGYYRNTRETGRVLRADGWLRTGDLARIDAEGHVWIVGRLKEVILRAGFSVYPPEVEAVIQQHPAVAVAAVLGLPHNGDEEVAAVVEPVRGVRLDLEELARFTAERLAPYKRPSRWLVVEEIPKTPTAKVLKARLREQLDVG